MNDIYIVFGSTGEYSDRSEWTIVAYADEALAQEHVLKATEIANVFEVLCAAGKLNYWDADFKANNIYDPDGHMDYTGTRYTYTKISVASALPTPVE